MRTQQAQRNDPKPRYAAYEWQKWRWVQDHPEATAEEYQKAMREIAKRCGV